MTVATHIDDILTGGGRSVTTELWGPVADRFQVKHWDIVEYDSTDVLCQAH